MRWRWYTLAWTFVFLVAAYDAAFAWKHRDSFHEWEMNPAARWGAEQFGLLAVFAFKFAGLTLAAIVAAICIRRGRRSGGAMTILTTVAYALLVVQYTTGDSEATPQEMRAVAMSPFNSDY